MFVRDVWTTTKDGQKVPTSRHGRGKRWQAVWTDAAGRERTRAFAVKAAAEQFARNAQTDSERGTFIDPRAGRIDLGAYADQWLVSQTSRASTRQSYANSMRLLQPLRSSALNTITPSQVQAWLRGLSADYAPSTIQQAHRILSSILRAAVDDGLIASNPARAGSVKAPKIERQTVETWTPAQVDAIAAALPERFRSMAHLGAMTGMRQGEMFALALGDIDWLGRRIHIRRQVVQIGGRLVFSQPKHGNVRTVPLPERLGLILAEHVRRFPPTSATLPKDDPSGEPWPVEGLLFTGAQGAVVNRNHFNANQWRPALIKADAALVKAGKPGIGEPSRATGCHRLRHTFAGTLLAGGVGVAAVAKWLGHSDAGFTLRVYGALVPDAEDRSRAVLEDAWPSSDRAEAERPAVTGL